MESVDEMDLNTAVAHSSSSPTRPLSSGLGPGLTHPPDEETGRPVSTSTTATPTGGLVDEVDPGSGGSETVEPVALSGASSSGPGRAKSPTDLLDPGNLRERFVRASSPRVSSPSKKDETETAESESAGQKGVSQQS